MKRFRIIFSSLLIGLVCAFDAEAQRPVHLTTDFLEHTAKVWSGGYETDQDITSTAYSDNRYQIAEIRSEHPLLGWQMEGTRDKTMQKASRVLVATSPALLAEGKADVWDSGKVKGSGSAMRIGAVLAPGTLYFWTVKLWSSRGDESGYAEPKAFRTAANLDGAQARYPLQKTKDAPASIRSIAENLTFIDFGKAAYGQLSFSARCTEPQTITVHFGEAVQDGRIMHPAAPSSIRYQSIAVALEAGTHSYTVTFPKDKRNSTIVPGRDYNPVLIPEYIGEIYPFRYCEIEAPSGIVDGKSIVRESVHYMFDDQGSAFESSDSILDQVWELCKYSIKATTALGVYIDGDRERIPYEADALINQLGHYCTDRDFSIARHTVEYLCRHATWPTEWILQAPLMAWNDYIYTGDTALLERNYDILKARTLIDLTEANGLISTRTGRQTPELMQRIGFAGNSVRDIVDWPQGGAAGICKESAGEADGFVFSDFNAVVNAFHYAALRAMHDIAGAIGQDADAAMFASRANAFAKTFNELLFDADKGCYRDGPGVEHCSLHTSMCAMAFGLVPEKEKARVLEYMRSRKMACSVYGAQFLLDALYSGEDAEYALSLLTDTSLRSWYNMIRIGSTVTLEAWDPVFKPNLDWNHAWGAAPANIIPRGLMGITPLTPGYGKVRIKPQTATLEHARIKVPTIRGDIGCSFSREGDACTLEVSIPANTSAEVWIPKAGGKYSIKHIGSGTYTFDYKQ